MKIHERLKDLREDHDLTQTQAGKIIGISQSDYGKYERGVMMMGVDKYIKFAKYYNISLDYLCGIINYPKKIFLEEPPTKFKIVPKSAEIAEAYKKAPDEIKKAIDILLKI